MNRDGLTDSFGYGLMEVRLAILTLVLKSP